MRSAQSRFTLLLGAALLVAVPPVPGAAAQAPATGPIAGSADRRAAIGSLQGTTVDDSGGVLPGVNVTVTSIDGRTLATAVTDALGRFELAGLPAGPVTMAFGLDGFESSPTTVVVTPGAAGPGADRSVHRLSLAGRSEQVVVRADPPPPAPPPPPTLEPLPEHDQASVCGPAMAEATVPSFGTVISRRGDETKVLFSAGDQLLIQGGTSTGLRVGENFVVRRRFPTPLRYGRNQVIEGEHSSGLLQIVDVQDRLSTAVVVYACDEIMRGDYLARFEPEPPVVPHPAGPPMFDKAARILFADAGEPLGVTGRMMVADLGERHGVRRGQRLTLFRWSRFDRDRPLVIGEAVVVSVRKDTCTIRVDQATDVIFFGASGDWAAPQAAPATSVAAPGSSRASATTTRRIAANGQP